MTSVTPHARARAQFFTVICIVQLCTSFSESFFIIFSIVSHKVFYLLRSHLGRILVTSPVGLWTRQSEDGEKI